MDYIERMLAKALQAEQRKAGIAPAVVETKPKFELKPAPRKTRKYPPQIGRCQSRLTTIHALDLSKFITLQCVKESGHKAGCHYENPGSESPYGEDNYF